MTVHIQPNWDSLYDFTVHIRGLAVSLKKTHTNDTFTFRNNN